MENMTTGNSRVGDEGVPGAVSFLAAVRCHWLRIVGIIAVCGVAGFLLTLAQPIVYTATVTLLPQQDDTDSNLMSRLAMFTGVYVGTEVSFEQLYTRIVLSDRLLDPLIDHEWLLEGATAPVDLYAVFDVDRSRYGEGGARERLKSNLRSDVITFARDSRTGFMTLKAAAPGPPQLAAALANALADALDDFNLEYRGAKAHDQRIFIQERLKAVRAALDSANAALTEFATANRTYRSAPALLQQYRDLEREVEAETTVWMELRRQLELARIEEGKPLTTITILDRASLPTERSGPKRGWHALVGALLGLLAAVVVIGFKVVLEPRSGP